LVSNCLISNINEIDIPIAKLSTLFDHKPITLSTKTKTNKRDLNKVKDSILDLLPVRITVELAVKEFYLNNADPDATPRYMINTLRFEIGRIFEKLKTASNIELAAITNNNLDAAVQTRISEIITEAQEITETLPKLHVFENLPLATEPDIFFEGLVLSVKNEILSKQAAIFKRKKLRKSLLAERLENCKKQIPVNF
jgi:hypothetical protein